MDDVFAALGALVWWKHDEDQKNMPDPRQQKIADARNVDAPRAWNAVVTEWKDG